MILAILMISLIFGTPAAFAHDDHDDDDLSFNQSAPELDAANRLDLTRDANGKLVSSDLFQSFDADQKFEEEKKKTN